MPPIDQAELELRFAFHPADTDEKRAAHEAVRDTCRAAAEDVVRLTPGPSREQSLAITALEEAMMWANAAIARHQPRTPAQA